MSQDPERVRDFPELGRHWFHWLRGPALGGGHYVWSSPLFGQAFAFHPTRKFVTITYRVLRIPVYATVVPFEDIVDVYFEESVDINDFWMAPSGFSDSPRPRLSIKVFMRVVAPGRTVFELAKIPYGDRRTPKHRAVHQAEGLLEALS